MAIKALFTDLGDTFRIVDSTSPKVLEARKRLVEICKSDMDPNAFYDYLNERYEPYRKWAISYTCEAPEFYLWSRWLTPELDKEYIAKYAKELTYNFRMAKGERKVVKDGIETVKELIKRGYKVGIISDLIGTIEIDEWLDNDNIRDLFCTVQQSSVTMLRKPHPALYYMAMKEAGVEPEECVFVGDNLDRDICGAKRTGFAGTIAADYKNTAAGKLNEENLPDCIIHEFSELLNVLPGEGKFCPDKAERRTL